MIGLHLVDNNDFKIDWITDAPSVGKGETTVSEDLKGQYKNLYIRKKAIYFPIAKGFDELERR
jgi:hypothetical protein